ncbi:hypothetical protein ADM90_19285 [Lysinibacillus macroides]|uniref:Uncharacterized protein n=2 Tax=Lysinibacillus macroides TaxID=33935 RepID=A0A0M9DIW0_9BACI|nr:hypothetical protein ADM90_19285 [Lysinibacillus macroides]
MNMPKVEDVMGTIPSNGESIQRHFAEIYRQIGIHFINNAERLGNSVFEGTSGVDIFISMDPNNVITIDISQKEILKKQGLTANATLGKLQVTPELKNLTLNRFNAEQTIEKIAEKLTEITEEITHE